MRLVSNNQNYINLDNDLAKENVYEYYDMRTFIKGT
jgi:hypothetical protein